MPQHEYSSQERILRTFTVLSTLRADWGGGLILGCGLNRQGAALALAANIAGAVCLSVEDDPVALKEALRSGSCDFIVNTLDEALRAMKNEVRKHLPLSVGLQGNLPQILQELIERGVSPQLFADFTANPGYTEAISIFRLTGAGVVNFSDTPPVEGEADINAEAALVTLLQERQWSLQSFLLSTPAELRSFDSKVLSLIPEDDYLRRRWLQAAPRILQRERPIRRTLWVTGLERQVLQAAVPSSA